MRTHAIFAVAAAIGLGAVSAQDVYDGDYPSACQSSCGEVVSQGQTCDDQNDEDAAEVQCLCDAPDMSNLMSECQSCIQQNSSDDDDLEDIMEIMNACGFAATTGTVTSSASQSSTTVFTTTSTETDDDGDTETDVDTVTSKINAGPPASPQTVTTTDDNGSTTVLTTATGGPAATTGNGGAAADSSSQPGMAVATAAPFLGAGAGALMAVIAAL